MERWESGHLFPFGHLAFIYPFSNNGPWFSFGDPFVLFSFNLCGYPIPSSNIAYGSNLESFHDHSD